MGRLPVRPVQRNGITRAAASYSEIDNHIEAYIHHATATSTTGSVNVNAVSDATIKSITGGANGGLVGIAGNVSVVFMGTRTEAYITNASVNAFANVTVTANAQDTWDVIAGALAGGLVGAAGSVVVNNSADVTRAFLDNAVVVAHGKGAVANVQHWDPDTGAESLEQVHGLAVVASFVGQPGSIGSLSINAGGGLVGIGGVVSTTKWQNHTDAFIAASNVDSSTDYGGRVIVRAHSDEDVQAITGGVGGGLVGVGGTIDRTDIESQTRAFISTSDESGADPHPGLATVYGQGGVEVSTVTPREDRSDRGWHCRRFGRHRRSAVSVTDVAVRHNSMAFIHDSDVFSHGDLAVLADDTVNVDPTVGTLGGAPWDLGALGQREYGSRTSCRPKWQAAI